jgi:4-aminobutyrate aminotransferase-like enzyme
MKEDKTLPYFITWTSQNDALTIPLERVNNDYFFDKDNKWLNLSSISYQASFGLKNSKILNAIKKQMSEFSLASPKQTFQLKQEVSTRLIEKTGSKYKCFFTLSGSEGIENALKMARQITGRKVFCLKKILIMAPLWAHFPLQETGATKTIYFQNSGPNISPIHK